MSCSLKKLSSACSSNAIVWSPGEVCSPSSACSSEPETSPGKPLDVASCSRSPSAGTPSAATASRPTSSSSRASHSPVGALSSSSGAPPPLGVATANGSGLLSSAGAAYRHRGLELGRPRSFAEQPGIFDKALSITHNRQQMAPVDIDPTAQHFYLSLSLT